MSPSATVEQPTRAEQPVRAARSSATKASTDQDAKTMWQVVWLSVEHIDPNPFQPRTNYDVAEMAELVESVKAHGVLQPITVRTVRVQDEGDTINGKSRNGQHSNGQSRSKGPVRYQLIAGERRLRACKQAGKKQIPAILRDDLSDQQVAELALLENIQRSNLTVIEEARGYKRLMIEFRMKEERIAKKVGKSVATIQATMKLLALPGEVQDLLDRRQLTASHGHALLPLAPHEKVCLSVAQHAVANNVTATALAQTPLPNIRELMQKKLVQELDFRTKFDWRSECAKCPFKAYMQSGYTNYCLKPPEWHKKQMSAMEQQKSEAAQAMQRVREEVASQEEAGQVDVTRLPAGSYRSLSRVELPAGCCEACPCRREVTDPQDENKTMPVCLDLARLQSLREAERKAHEEQRKRHYLQRWTQAISVLQDEAELAQPRKAATLLTYLVLRNELYRSTQHEGTEAATLPRNVALNLGIALPWSELIEAREDVAILKLLEGALEGAVDHEGGREALGERLTAPDSNQLLLFAVALMLASEAQHAVKWAEVTPRLDFVLGPQGIQGELDVAEGQTASGRVDQAEELPDADAQPSPFYSEGGEEDELADDWEEDQAFEEESLESELIKEQPLEPKKENQEVNSPED